MEQVSKCQGYIFIVFGLMKIFFGPIFLLLMFMGISMRNPDDVSQPILAALAGVAIIFSGINGVIAGFVKKLKTVQCYLGHCLFSIILLLIFVGVHIMFYRLLLANLKTYCEAIFCNPAHEKEIIIRTIIRVGTFFGFGLLLLIASSVLAGYVILHLKNNEVTEEQPESLDIGFTRFTNPDEVSYTFTNETDEEPKPPQLECEDLPSKV
ncbi:uncharacterized protein LOC135691746 isoform X2 [Rhopilema esculentum]|uniref:uncharacterized protein LOC135691746 isoform X1 n=1 Tax=Rhopilema esculentum TaxID=499914 RepID=UPI0031D59BBD